MKTQKLVILGILKEGPRHGYQIKKTIRQEIGAFTALENKSIYYPLKVMERGGLISRRTVPGQGNLFRHEYSITPKGEKEFLILAKEALISQKRPFIDIDIPLYFLPQLEKKEIVSRLRLRKRFLDRVKSWLETKLVPESNLPAHQRLLLRHHLNLLSAEDRFVKEIIGIVKNYRDNFGHPA